MNQVPRVTLEYFKNWWQRRVDKPIPKSVTDDKLREVLKIGNDRAEELHRQRHKKER